MKSLVIKAANGDGSAVASFAMISSKPYSPRMAALMAIFFISGIDTSILAQELNSIVNGRVDAGIDRDADKSAISMDGGVKRGGWEIGAAVSTAYDSNVFLESKEPDSDTVVRIAPGVAYSHGDQEGMEGSFVKVAYRPTAVVYTGQIADNRVDHQAGIEAGWLGKTTRATYSGAIEKLADAIADTGRQTDRVSFQNELRGAWIPRERVSIELAGGNRASDYVDPTLFDSSKIYGEAAVRFAYSPKTQLGAAYQVAKLQVDNSPDQTTQQLTGAIKWQPREKIALSLEAGAEHRKTQNGSSVNPVVDGRIDWMPQEGTSFYVTGYQREEASAFLFGQNYRVKGVTAGVAQKLGEKWKARLEVGRETASYSRVAGSGSGGRNDKIWFVRPALEYNISEKCDVALFYRASENDSNQADFGYRQTMAGVELNYKF